MDLSNFKIGSTASNWGDETENTAPESREEILDKIVEESVSNPLVANKEEWNRTLLGNKEKFPSRQDRQAAKEEVYERLFGEDGPFAGVGHLVKKSKNSRVKIAGDVEDVFVFYTGPTEVRVVGVGGDFTYGHDIRPTHQNPFREVETAQFRVEQAQQRLENIQAILPKRVEKTSNARMVESGALGYTGREADWDVETVWTAEVLGCTARAPGNLKKEEAKAFFEKEAGIAEATAKLADAEEALADAEEALAEYRAEWEARVKARFPGAV